MPQGMPADRCSWYDALLCFLRYAILRNCIVIARRGDWKGEPHPWKEQDVEYMVVGQDDESLGRLSFAASNLLIWSWGLYILT
jgi:hypothetical protein